MMRNAERGQSLVEFALVLPIFLMLLVAVFDIGHVVWANDALASAAEEATRYAIVHGGSESTTCPVGPPAPTARTSDFDADCAFPSPSREAVRDAARRWLNGVGGDAVISVCYGAVAHCAGDVDQPNATNARGTPVTVSISARLSLAAPSLLGIGPIGISASSTMLVNH